MIRKSPIMLVILSLVVVLCALMPAPVAARPPFDLHAYPVVPAMRGAVASKARAIARTGRQLGNRSTVFSKIGDSITDWTQFLVPVGTGGLRLGKYAALQSTVNWFTRTTARTHNSFANLSIAARGAWTSWSLLEPGANFLPDQCGAGEAPIDCELRVTKPAIALIMIGTNDLSYGDIAAFANNIDRILASAAAHGVVPVISTIPYRKDRPDAFERVDAYNETIIRVARKNSTAVWNYWLAMEGLPNNGLGGDNVHPSIPEDGNTAIFDDAHLQAGFTVRNLTALQVLSSVLTVVR